MSQRTMSNLRSSVTSQISELTSRQAKEDLLDFGIGQPSPSLLQPLVSAVQEAFTDRFSTPDAHLLLQYGSSNGYLSFRAALAQFLSERYGYAVAATDLFTVAGVSHGLDVVCRTLLPPGALVLTEAPTYLYADKIFRSNHMEVLGMAADTDGLDVDALQRWLEDNPTRRPAALYTIPVFNNPRGSVLSGERRERLVRLAHHYGFWIIADEVYQMLQFPNSAAIPPPLRSFDSASSSNGSNAGYGGSSSSAGDGGSSTAAAGICRRVVSLGSFSKIMAPGLRLGWVEADGAVLKALHSDGALVSGGCMAQLAAAVTLSALQLGSLQHHLDTQIRPTLASRCAALCAALRSHCGPLGCTFDQPSGGYFVWLQLPTHVDAQQLLQHCRTRHSVAFTAGAACGGASHCARLSFAFYTEAELEMGVEQLAAALASYAPVAP